MFIYMFCRFCSELLEEDNSICDNKVCKYLNEKIKVYGLLPFYLICYNSLEKYQKLLEKEKSMISQK